MLGTAVAGRSQQLSSTGVCVDTSSPSAAIDRRVASAAFAAAGASAHIVTFDGGSGVADRYFRYLAKAQCSIVMGFPLDTVGGDAPDGLETTQPYVHTGYVLATIGKRSLKSLPANAQIGVGAATSPNFYVVGALGPVPAWKADTYRTQEEVAGALLSHTDDAAMVWQLSFERYRATHPAAARVVLTRLTFPHALWDIAALYDPKKGTDAARTFERGLSLLRQRCRLAGLVNSPLPE